jgi:hypothetical protein
MSPGCHRQRCIINSSTTFAPSTTPEAIASSVVAFCAATTPSGAAPTINASKSDYLLYF